MKASGAQAAAERVVHILSERGLTLAVAESCTGGLIGHLLTNVAGSSRCFIGGVAAYHGRAKTTLLGVTPETLRAHGSVSAETALAMARGVRERLETDIGVGVTGIAGPTGGTAARPVGTVYLALADRGGGARARHAVWSGSREECKEQSAGTALDLVLDHLGASEP